ncbi:trypsin-like peptidase domain-containing protein [Alicyclobacillus cycloheptanicus]|uniref:S1-C subfamily serine protease n=1 Tax=Alicyclobacillus cycloheptanicus TaxID=1457 RepID=A0ABT9XFE5_9BACL|nr:trypsin-like peptidase domain-containing protein [Alicyclobacillus cycloheptanicus]MDQ0188461.1 S1-C subfamily serine protease [Alicyclobacillus cycloheptanicus]WDM01154.1 trypsin-like peptidase domain-containing protein [Alicyclobacillus cycloheptanicus]
MVQRTKRATSRKPARPSATLLPNFADLVDRYKKAVVGIEVVQEQSSQRTFSFGMPWDRLAGPSPRSVNIGTGFVFDERGYILTNEHVVHGAARVMMRLYGRKKPVPARIIGTDYVHDIAILQADGSAPNTVLRIGRSKNVRVGEWVVAIGSPLGLDHTVTVGIISSTERPMQIGDREYPNLLQTDAAINRGNSGGPLINLRGEVVGMNTAVSQSSQGIGFAIAADVLRDAIQRIL